MVCKYQFKDGEYYGCKNLSVIKMFTKKPCTINAECYELGNCKLCGSKIDISYVNTLNRIGLDYRTYIDSTLCYECFMEMQLLDHNLVDEISNVIEGLEQSMDDRIVDDFYVTRESVKSVEKKLEFFK